VQYCHKKVSFKKCSTFNLQHALIIVSQSHSAIFYVVSRSSIGSLQEWSLPEYGIFELDYVSCYRPPARAKPLSDELWESLMVSMYNCKESGDSARESHADR
jgi:hypothetical protein